MKHLEPLDTMLELTDTQVKELYELVMSHSQVTEQTRKLTAIMLDRLIELKLFRVGLPKALGGWEGNPVDTLKLYELLASADPATAWVIWNGHLSCTLGRFLDEDSLKEVYHHPSHIYANSGRPEGIAKSVPGGYRVSGQWTLVSGSSLADWFVLRCLVTSEGTPKTLGPGANLKFFFVPKKEVEILDTWDVCGLNGTGSHDVKADNVFVKESYAVNFDSPVALNTAYNRLPIGCINAAGCAAMTLGVVKLATDELINLCLQRVTEGDRPDMRDNSDIQKAVAKSKQLLASKRGQLHRSTAVLWEASERQTPLSDEQLADVWAISCETANEAKAMVTEIYRVAGTAALYKKYKIEKAHRDIHAILQHAIIQPHWMSQAGMAYLNITPTKAMFRT